MESNDKSPNEFRFLNEEELLALSDEDKIQYLKEKRSFDLRKANEALKKSAEALGKVNKKMLNEMKE